MISESCKKAKFEGDNSEVLTRCGRIRSSNEALVMRVERRDSASRLML